MSTEIEIGGLNLPIAAAAELSGEIDQVVLTADDRPRTDMLPVLADPTVDHADECLRRRRDDIEEKHRRICAFMDETRHDAVVLGLSDSVAWFTSGGELGQDLGSDHSAVLLFINRACRAVIADNVHSSRVFEEELAGLGFTLKERPWYEDTHQLMAELCQNKRVATDLGWSGCSRARRESDALRSIRRRLTALEKERLRSLGQTIARAVEATALSIQPGERETEVAGQLAHRLIREGVVPIDLRVAGDDRPARFRRPNPKSRPIEKRALIGVTGRRHGLCASVSRVVAFGRVESSFRRQHTVTTMVDASCIFFSRPGEKVSEVFRRAKRIYEKFGEPDEWVLDYQGYLIGYSPREALLRPDSDLVIDEDMALAWSPSVGAARCEDTIIVGASGFEVTTAQRDWPMIDVAVKGQVIARPGILER